MIQKKVQTLWFVHVVESQEEELKHLLLLASLFLDATDALEDTMAVELKLFWGLSICMFFWAPVEGPSMV